MDSRGRERRKGVEAEHSVEVQRDLDNPATRTEWEVNFPAASGCESTVELDRRTIGRTDISVISLH